MRYTTRFNLGLGKNHKKVKVTDKLKSQSEYLEPEGLVLEFIDAKLVNQKGTAIKIYEGEHKKVCAFVSSAKVNKISAQKGYEPIYYNPKESPYWRDSVGNNIDGQMFDRLYMIGRQVYRRVK